MSDTTQYDPKTLAFSEEEQKEIVDLVIAGVEADRGSLFDWREQKKKDLQAAFNQSPAKIEGLTKEQWMSDRNTGVCGSTCDALIAAQYASCWNPDSIHAQPTEKNDVDRASNVEKFVKATVTDPRNNISQEIREFTTNIVQTGFGVLKTFWVVEEKIIDKVSYKEGVRSVKEGEKRIFEYAKIKNIANSDDILCPDYGINIQELNRFAEVLHLTGFDIDRMVKKGVFMNVDDDFKREVSGQTRNVGDGQEAAKSEELEVYDVCSPITKDEEIEYLNSAVDIIEAYYYFEKGGKLERYRFYIHEGSRTFLGGKLLRKIVPSGRIPYAACPFEILTGHLRGRSMPRLIWDVCNQINTVFNQKTDFQTVLNMPIGFYDPSDPNIKGAQVVVPGRMYPSASPERVNIINRQGSDAWAYNDIQFLLQQVERISGAASYFLTTESKGSTATRDAIVAQKSDTRTGIWIRQELDAIAQILNIYLELYQMFAPANLGSRLLGKKGEELFNEFSAEQIEGYYDVKMSPDIIAGSKAYKAQVALQRFNLMSQNPMIANYGPGYWKLTRDTLKDTGTESPEQYLPEEPDDPMKIGEEIENEFSRMQQGEEFDPPEGATSEAVAHYQGHMQQMLTKSHLLDDEGKQRMQDHIFETLKNMKAFQQELEQERIANSIALGGNFGQGNATGLLQQQPGSDIGGIGQGAGGIVPGEGLQSVVGGQEGRSATVGEDSGSVGEIVG